MKALIVGGTGPTGPHIIEGLLSRGYHVTTFNRGTHDIPLPKGVERIFGDPHFLETIEEALGDHTFDLVVASYGRLRHVAEAMKRRTPRFIALGGAGVYRGIIDPSHYPPAGPPVPTAEDAPLITDPEMHRFAFKMVAAEEAVMKIHREEFFNATIFRVPLVYGPRQPAPLEWSIMRRVLDGRKSIIVPDGGLTLETRGYGENIAHAVLLAVDKPEISAGEIYNVGDERVLSLAEWVALIADTMGHSWELVNVPMSIAIPSHPYLTVPSTHHRVFDLTKIKKELGYRDILSVEEALKKTVEWYLKNRPLPGGEEEKSLFDPFNYKSEDELVEGIKESVSRLSQISYSVDERQHPYAHPKEAGEARDHRGR